MTKPSKNPAVVYLSKWSATSDTRKTMRAALDRIAKVLDATSTAETYAWHELRYEDVRAIPAQLKDEKLKPRTVNKCLSALRGVLEVAWRSGVLPDEEYRRIKIENVRGGSVASGRVLSPEELDRVVNLLPGENPQDAAIIAVMAGAGLRRVEVVKLLRGSYDATAGRIVALGKGDKERSIPVGKRWRPALEAWWKTREPGALLFDLPEIEDEDDPRDEVTNIVRRFWKKHGFAKFTPHDLRRTFATHVCATDIAVAQRLLGHANMQTTTIYDRRGEQVEDDAVEDL